MEIKAYEMVTRDEPFRLAKRPKPEVKTGYALVKVAGCGVCHTDLSFWHHGVPTRHPLPLVLGHEISGHVLEGPKELINQAVVIPAVLPCGECSLCKKGRSNICQNQQMPGNDFHGGFASHVVVPARFLIPIPNTLLETYEVAELAVIADAVSTPYQAIQKSGLGKGEVAIIIGVGGIGIYAVQIARALGGKVLAIDIDEQRLDRVRVLSSVQTLNTRDMDVRAIKKQVKQWARESGADPFGWKIFEMSGTKGGQTLAYALLSIAGTLSIVGFTMDKLEFRLSNLMAFDAQAIGTWGCRPELYPDVLNLVAKGEVEVRPYSAFKPLSKINEIFQGMLKHAFQERIILKPDFN